MINTGETGGLGNSVSKEEEGKMMGGTCEGKFGVGFRGRIRRFFGELLGCYVVLV
jgi:hypothetical protein